MTVRTMEQRKVRALESIADDLSAIREMLEKMNAPIKATTTTPAQTNQDFISPKLMMQTPAPTLPQATAQKRTADLPKLEVDTDEVPHMTDED